MSDLVLEIGVENLPASYVPPAVEQLRRDAAAMLERSRLVYEEIYTAGTPRRLVLIVRGLPPSQGEGEEVVTGPPVAKAFSPDGRPTPAAEGFARAQGLSVDGLARVETPRGEYIAVRRRLPRRRAAAVLGEEIPALVAGLKFPKAMKWEASGARFARPVRWIVALCGREVVRCRYAGVESGRTTWGRPWLRTERRSVPSASAYLARVESMHVVVDQNARKRRIRELAERAASSRGLRLVEDEDLLTELAFMLEDPRVLVGSFPETYLRLPAEVVITAMRSHQRYVALTDRKGKLVPAFVAFTDGPVRGPSEVVKGNERVLKARLDDASFYWREDLKRGIDALADELDRIVFVEGLGSMGDKWRRVHQLAREVNAKLPEGQRAGEAALERASRLAKADLASTMIRDGKEFTALQGVIGAHYAISAGEAPDVAAAVREHYLPRGSGDPLPGSPLGRLLALADRVDTIVGCFLVGLKPSGSQDPFALRRAANGAIRILCEIPGVPIVSLVDRAVESYRTGGDAEKARSARSEMLGFWGGRVETFLKENGVPYDVADAVVPASWAEPGIALDRAREIARLRGDPGFERLITGVKRVGNILPKDRRRLGASWEDIRTMLGANGAGRPSAFHPERFQEPSEHSLWEALRTGVDKIAQAEARRRFADVLGALSRLADPIDAYFDHVLVNCEDPAVRKNRLDFLASVYAVFGRYADFLAIVEPGEATVKDPGPPPTRPPSRATRK